MSKSVSKIGGSWYTSLHRSLPHLFDLPRVEFELVSKSNSSSLLNIYPVHLSDSELASLSQVLDTAEKVTEELQLFYRIHLEDYKEILEKTENFGVEFNIPVVKVPERLLKWIMAEGQWSQEDQAYLERLERNVKLKQSQRYSVKFGIEQYGRVFLANDRAMGKTLEALAIMMRWVDDFPLMIIWHNDMKEHWRQEILKWFSGVEKEVIRVVEKATESFDLDELIYILSYDSASKLFSIKSNKIPLSKFKSFILDDAHEFKNRASKKVKALRPFLKEAKHIVFWSAVPRIVSPSELYLYMNLLRPDIFNSYPEFATRYWKASLSDNRTLFLNDKGFSKSKELNLILYEKLMVRFVSAQNQKPSERVLLEVELDISLKETSEEAYKLLSAQKNRNKNISEDEYVIPQKNNAIKYITTMRKSIGLAKVKSTVDFISSKLPTWKENKSNIIVFYWHNSIKELLIKELEGIQWKVIDLSKLSHSSKHKIKAFNESVETQVALIRINRISSHFELPNVEVGIFWELSFSPFDHIIAEKMMLGQSFKSKEIYYIVGWDSKVDNWMLSRLQQKQWTHSIYFHNDKKWRDQDKHSAFNFKAKHIPEKIKHYLSQNDAYESTAFSNNKNSWAVSSCDVNSDDSLFANSETVSNTQDLEEVKASQENRLSRDDMFSDNSQTVRRIRVSWDRNSKDKPNKNSAPEIEELEIINKVNNNWYSLPQFEERWKQSNDTRMTEPDQDCNWEEKLW